MQNGWTLALAHLASRLLQPGDWRQAAEDGCGAICALEGVRRVAVFRLLGQGGAAPAQRCLVDCHRPGLAALGEATGVLAPPGRWLAGASGRLRKGLVATGRAAGESGPVRHFLDHFGIVRYLIAPLMVDGRWWGHIFLDIDDSGAGWTEERIAVVSTMTVLIAQAIKRDESPAAMSEATRLAMLQSSPDGIITIDEAGTVLEFNPAAERLFGFSREEAVGAPLVDLIIPRRHCDHHKAGFVNYLATGQARVLGQPVETEARRADGSELPVELIVTEVRAAGRRLFTAYLTDISARLAARNRLERLAFFDSVTDLPNLAWLEERSRWAKGGPQSDAPPVPGAAIVVRLRRFALLSSSVGPEIAGEILRHAAQRLRDLAGDGITVISIGGAEFALVLEKGEYAGAVADAAIDLIGTPCDLDGRRFYVDASCGIVRTEEGCPRSIVGAQVRDAQLAARTARPHEVVRFDSALRAAFDARLLLEADLREAVHRRSEEIHLAYQPIYDLRTRRLVGFEALARWHHSRRGAISPAEFIPLAEAAGLAGPLGEWLCERAIREAVGWRRYAGSREAPYVSVNLAPVRVAEPGLVDSIAATMAAAGADPSRVHFEITETALMANPEEAAATLRRLRGLGTRIMIDDFGTGYSNFNYLRQLPIDTLKIDRAFISDIDQQVRARDVLRALVALAHSLGLNVVAEGVETEAALALVAEFGCDYVQGFLLARPMAPEAARELVTAQTHS